MCALLRDHKVRSVLWFIPNHLSRTPPPPPLGRFVIVYEPAGALLPIHGFRSRAVGGECVGGALCSATWVEGDPNRLYEIATSIGEDIHVCEWVCSEVSPSKLPRSVALLISHSLARSLSPSNPQASGQDGRFREDPLMRFLNQPRPFNIFNRRVCMHIHLD